VDSRAAERVDAHANMRSANGIHVDDIAEIVHVTIQEIVSMDCRRVEGLLERHPPHTFQAVAKQIIGLFFDPAGDVGIRRTAIGRVVF